MEIGLILTVIFGLIVWKWMLQAFFPKTSKKISAKLHGWLDKLDRQP